MILVSKSVGAGAAHNVTCWTCYESPRVTVAPSWMTQGAAAWQSAQMNLMVLEPQSRKLISPPRSRLPSNHAAAVCTPVHAASLAMITGAPQCPPRSFSHALPMFFSL